MSKCYIIETRLVGSAITAAIVLTAPLILSSRAFAISPDNITNTGIAMDFVEGPDLQVNQQFEGGLLESASLTATFTFDLITNVTIVTLSADAEITQGYVNKGQNEPLGLQRQKTQTLSITETNDIIENEDGKPTFEVTTNEITGPAEEFTCPSATMKPVIASVLLKDITLKIEGYSGPTLVPAQIGRPIGDIGSLVYTITATFPDQNP